MGTRPALLQLWSAERPHWPWQPHGSFYGESGAGNQGGWGLAVSWGAIRSSPQIPLGFIAWGINKAPGSARGSRKFQMHLTKTLLHLLPWDVFPPNKEEITTCPVSAQPKNLTRTFLGTLPGGAGRVLIFCGEGEACVLKPSSAWATPPVLPLSLSLPG